MNFFQIIQARFNRAKILRLGAPQSLDEDTQEIITIDTIKKILHDKSTFEKFLNWKQNQGFFSKGLSFEDYVQAVEDYILFFGDRGVRFDKNELKRANLITGKKYRNNKIENGNLQTPEELIAETIYNTGGIEDIISQGNNKIDKCVRNGIYELPKIFSAYRVSLNESIINSISSLQKADVDVSDKTISGSIRKRFNPNEYSINKDLKELIISKIPGNINDKGQIAYMIYKAVFSTLQHESGYFIKKRDVSQREYTEMIKEKDVSEVTLENRRAACTAATEFYCYMLSLYGIESNIIEGYNIDENNIRTRGHWYAEVLLDDDTIKADGTNGITDIDGFFMSDMTRLKIGLRPANFISRNGIVYEDEMDAETPGYFLKKEVSSLIEAIDSFDSDMQANYSISISHKVKILQMQLMKLHADDIGSTETIQYLKELFRALFSTEQRRDTQMIGLSTSLYTDEEKDICSYFPIIYLKQQDDGYAYYTLDNEKGLKSIKAHEIKGMMQNHRLQIVVGKENQIPELYDDDCEMLEHIPEEANDLADDQNFEERA